MAKNALVTVAICGVILGSLAAPAWSGEERGSGTVTYIPVDTETAEAAGGGMVQQSHLEGIVLANDPLTKARRDILSIIYIHLFNRSVVYQH